MMKFNMVITDLKRNKKKNISIKNQQLAFGAADGLQ